MPHTLGEKTWERQGLDHLSPYIGSGRLLYVQAQEGFCYGHILTQLRERRR
jgi:hypothetical protein